MRKILAIFAIAAVAASCNTTADRQREAAMEAQQKTIDSMKIEMAKQSVIDSMNEVARLQFVVPQTVEPVTTASTPKAKATTTRKRSTARRSTSRNTGYANTRNTNTQPVYTQPTVYEQPAPVATTPTQEKRGWSAKAKGAVIGAGAGAVGGAIINKKDRVKGAVVGGVLGAGAGVGIGAVIDKKNGR